LIPGDVERETEIIRRKKAFPLFVSVAEDLKVVGRR